MSDTKLRCCPFCGGEARIQHYRNGDCAIECIECYGKTHRSVTEDLAIRRWNTRKPIDRIVEQLKELKTIYYLTIANTGDVNNDLAYRNVVNALDKAIEIVRKGGVE